MVGRDPELCQILYPPEYTVVGREHVALLRKLSGDYALDMFGDHYTEVNGEPCELEAPIPNGGKFVLGRRGGPERPHEQNVPENSVLSATSGILLTSHQLFSRVRDRCRA